MPLSIRGRLTLWYGLVLLVVLIGAGGAILVLYSQLGLANIDRQLQNRAATVAAEVLQELEEGETLDESVEEVEDIELPETGVAVVDEADVVLIFRDIGLLDTHESVVGARDGAVTVESSLSGCGSGRSRSPAATASSGSSCGPRSRTTDASAPRSHRRCCWVCRSHC